MKKTTPKTAAEILQRLAMGVPGTRIAREYGIERRTVYLIKKYPSKYLFPTNQK